MCLNCKRTSIGIIAGCLLADTETWRGQLSGNDEAGRATAERLGQLLDEIQPFAEDDIAIRERAAELVAPLSSNDLALLRQLTTWAAVALMDLGGPIIAELDRRAADGDDTARKAMGDHVNDAMLVGLAMAGRQRLALPHQLPTTMAGIPS